MVAGINEKRQLDIFRVLSGILHMGNMLYQEGDNETCTVPVSTCKYRHGFPYTRCSHACQWNSVLLVFEMQINCTVCIA